MNKHTNLHNEIEGHYWDRSTPVIDAIIIVILVGSVLVIFERLGLADCLLNHVRNFI